MEPEMETATAPRERVRLPLRSSGRGRSALPAARPPFWPQARWTRIALVFLLAFTLLRGMLVAITIPHFWAPDEDYHYLYAQYLTTQHALPGPDKPMYPPEYGRATTAIDYDSYCCGPVGERFRGDPKAVVKETSGLPEIWRQPNEAGRGVGVVHPPLYQLAAAGVIAAGGDSSILTRVTWVRFLTAVFGALAVYAAWLLAAQVFRNPRLQLLTAFIVAVQPMVMYQAGIVNHDSTLYAFTTLALAMVAFILRSPPRAAQGAWLGGAIVLALFVKGSAFALIPVAALGYLLQWLTHREHGREVLRSAGVALGLVLVLAAWWYVRARIVYGSATGSTNPITGGTWSPGGASLGQLFGWAKEWTGLTYRTYWFHHLWFSAPGPMFGKYVPIVFGAIGVLGLASLGWLKRRTLLALEQPLLRQLLVLLVAALAFFIPFMVVDLLRRADGLPFYVNGGRYLLPVYAAVAVLFVAGVDQLVRREHRALVFTAVGASALAFGFWAFSKFSLFFYFGRPSVGELFRELTFNRPAFVTQGFVWALVALIGASLAGFAAALWLGRRDPHAQTATP
jgi:4-amino-4-deoxy-L-arabinose transferase-like glycosyltransferase